MKVLLFSSLSFSLVNFRGRLLKALADAGHEVIACAPDRNAWVEESLAQWGVQFRITPMARAGFNPLQDLCTLTAYIALIRRERPDTIIAYTQKPIIYGGLAARLTGGPAFHALMTGLGYVFSAEADGRPLLRKVVSRIYRAGVRDARTIFVFNGDDRRTMMANGIIGHAHHVVQVPGSGVDLDHFAFQPLPDAPLTFLMIGRLMRDKGVYEFVEAARRVREAHPNARFRLLGRPEPHNPTGVRPTECEAWSQSGLVELLPETLDVRPHLASAHVFVLPSFYREGLPRTILEAMAVGRPVITTDMPGCREPVAPGETGLLVPARDAGALAGAMMALADNRPLLEQMAHRARIRAVAHYDVDKVNAMLLDCMHLTDAKRADLSRFEADAVQPLAERTRAPTHSNSFG